MIKIYEGDVVEILPGCSFQSLVYCTGVVEQALPFGMAIVKFQQDKYWCDPHDLNNKVTCNTWLIPFNKLKVLDSPHDTRLGELEEEILGLEADLVTARACLSVSEEMRDKQFDLIEKLIEEIDVLKSEVYHLRNLNG